MKQVAMYGLQMMRRRNRQVITMRLKERVSYRRGSQLTYSSALVVSEYVCVCVCVCVCFMSTLRCVHAH